VTRLVGSLCMSSPSSVVEGILGEAVNMEGRLGTRRWLFILGGRLC